MQSIQTRNKILFIVVLFITFISSVSIYYTYKKGYVDKRLKEIATKEYLENNILQSINVKDFDSIEMYIDIANYLKIDLNPDIKNELNENNGLLSNSWKKAKDFSNGFLTGESSSKDEFMGSVASDMTVVGDIRDISNEGNKFINNEEYDRLVLSLSVIGVALSSSQFITLGTTTPLKVGVSLIKISKRMGNLSKPFLQYISTTVSKTVDTNVLKKIDFSNLSEIKIKVKQLSNSLNFTDSSSLFKKINTLKQNTSTFDTIHILKYIDTPKELANAVELSTKYKKNTKGVVQILGKKALNTSVFFMEYLALLVFEILILFLSFIGSLFLLFGKIIILNSIKKVFSPK